MARPANVDRVLALLRGAREPVSGSALSRDLGVSRTAIWKYIGELRELGYRIEARPARGYRVLRAPDRLLPAEIARLLATSRVGREIRYFERIGSTNTEAVALARQGAGEGSVVIAEAQSRGRGRMGREWFSPAGVNLYASIVLRPAVPPAVAPQLSLVAGLAVARALEAHGVAAIAIKWPNDVLAGGKKIAGVLTETEAEADRVRWVVLGVGVNLNCLQTRFPAHLRKIATSVRICTGRKVDRCQFTAHLFAEIETLYDRFLESGFAELKAEFEARSSLTGQEVAVESGGRRILGRALGVDEAGALVVQTAGGKDRIVAGDVTLRGTPRRR